jgi:hypothetical protein
VTLIPIAAFLAGSLLTILLPILLLIGIVAWYVRFVRRMPDPAAPGGLDHPAPGAPEPPATIGIEGDKHSA